MKLTKKVIGSGVVAAALVATTVTTAVFGNVTEDKSNYKVADVKERYAQKNRTADVQKKVFNISDEADEESAIVAAISTVEIGQIVTEAQKKEVKANEVVAGDIQVEAQIETQVKAESAAKPDPWENVLLPNVEDLLNIRAEASTDSEPVGILRRGCSAQIEEVGDEWTKISSGSVEGYVKNEYCVYGQEAKALAEEVCETTVTANTPGLRVRESADTESTIVDVLEEEETLKADKDAETVEGWVAVVCGDTTAYVSSDYVDVELQMGTALSMEEELARIAAEQEAARKAAEEQAAKEKAEREAAQASEKAQTSSSESSSGTSSGSDSYSESESSSSDSSSQNEAVSASSDDLSLLAALIYCEAGGEPYEGQVAVGAVVMNRVRSGSFPNSIRDVIYQSGQFSPASSGALSRAMANGNYCYSAAEEALAGADNTGGALYFRAGTSSGKGIVIGRQTFY